MNLGRHGRALGPVIVLGLILALSAAYVTGQPGTSGDTPARVAETVPGMPPVRDAANLYSETRSDKLSATAVAAAARVYVPHLQSNDVYVIDQATLEVVDRFRVGVNPQHMHGLTVWPQPGRYSLGHTGNMR